MENSGQPAMKKPAGILYGFLGLFIVLFLAAYAVTPVERGIDKSRRNALIQRLGQVQAAALNYYTEYSVYPVAPDNVTLIQKLTNDNPRHIEFLSLKPSDQNAQGEMLDPWRTPIEMSVTEEGKFHWRSAGPDKTFGTADDITVDFSPSDSK
jgi:type II secretory pathway pseudopilin PulG